MEMAGIQLSLWPVTAHPGRWDYARCFNRGAASRCRSPGSRLLRHSLLLFSRRIPHRNRLFGLRNSLRPFRGSASGSRRRSQSPGKTSLRQWRFWQFFGKRILHRICRLGFRNFMPHFGGKIRRSQRSFRGTLQSAFDRFVELRHFLHDLVVEGGFRFLPRRPMLVAPFTHRLQCPYNPHNNHRRNHQSDCCRGHPAEEVRCEIHGHFFLSARRVYLTAVAGCASMHF
jgi:hypothetical protein